MTYARCPECDLPANIVDRLSLTGTDGPVDHVKIVCVGGHWFTPTADEVKTYSAPVPQAAPADPIGAPDRSVPGPPMGPATRLTLTAI